MSDAPSHNPAPSSDAKFQALCRNLVGALYMLVRSVKLYDPENAIFQKPLNLLLETCNFLVAKEGKLDLTVVNGAFFVNEQLVRLDANTAEHVRYLVGEMEAHKVGGFALTKSATMGELKNFVWVFAKELPSQEELSEDGLEGKKLASMKLIRWSKLREKLNNQKDDDAKVDRKKYALTLYARAVFFVGGVLKALAEGKSYPAMNMRAGRLVQDLIDVSQDYGSQLLGMSTSGPPEEALAYHLANTCLVALAFGGELGLSKAQLKDLGIAALLNETSLARVPPAERLRARPERMPVEAQRRRVQADQQAATGVLAESGSRKLGFLRALSCVQMHQTFGTAVRTTAGKIQMVVPAGDPLYFSRILAICSYYDLLTSTTTDHEAFGPDLALQLMWNYERQRFDPELLAVFCKVMARTPIKALKPGQGRMIDIAGV
ncbi:MAG: hypothetical protein QM765_36665 [Myxococcales bacterium]